MNEINLYILTRPETEYATEYANILSGRQRVHVVRNHEYRTLQALVKKMEEKGVSPSDMSGFYYSYEIARIGKEFDLLKFRNKDKVLNIELKSQTVPKEKIRAQLERNRYYLNQLASELMLFTFVEETDKIYQLKEESFVESSIEELIKAVKEFGYYTKGEIEDYFNVKSFLISPLNNPELFLRGKYFLTQQQEQMEKIILKGLMEPGEHLYGITGNTGTGKTLLLYDLAKKLSKKERCLVVHCGMLNKGHAYLKGQWTQVDFFSVKDLTEEIIGKYRYILVDEAQRLYLDMLEKILHINRSENRGVVFSYNSERYLTKKEQKRAISEKLREEDGYQELLLSDKIRTSTEIISFFRNMMDKNDIARGKTNYSDIEILFANDIAEAKNILCIYLNEKKYSFIAYPYSFYLEKNRCLLESAVKSQDIVGQEYDNVLILMDDNFIYGENGKLNVQETVVRNESLFFQLSEQAFCRTIGKLCILVLGNSKLFADFMHIKSRVLWRLADG